MKPHMFGKINYLDILGLRTIVLALGEAHYFGWWKSGFLSPTGLSILERSYPHTYFAAAIHSSLLSALDVHDANIGKGQIFHLFRLSQGTERELETVLKEDEHKLKIRFQEAIGDQQFLLSTLEGMANGQKVGDAIGPILLKTSTEKMVPLLSAYYLQAFQLGKHIFPYFEEVD
jgi:hypothetical protein